MSGRRFSGASLLLVALAASAASCNRSVDIKQAIEVVDASSGWYDAGIVEGKNKIVPSVTFRLKKKGGRGRGGHGAERGLPASSACAGSQPRRRLGRGLHPARRVQGRRNETDPLTVRTEKGYTGEPPQSRLDILKNSQFRDVRARIYAKYSSSQWVEIGAVDVQRQLLVR